MNEKNNILSLFSGTQSWTQFYDKSKYNIYNIDLMYHYSDTLCRNILIWDYKDEIKDKIDIIYASPPCNFYFTNMKHGIMPSYSRNKGSGNRNYTEYEKKLSLDLVNKTIEIIEYFKPKFWIIENPRAKMRKHYPKILNREPITIDYCRYGVNYKKPTDLWLSFEFNNILRCNHKKHDKTIKRLKSGKYISEQYRAMIPEELSLEISNFIKNTIK